MLCDGKSKALLPMYRASEAAPLTDLASGVFMAGLKASK